MENKNTQIMKHNTCNNDKFLERKTMREEFNTNKDKNSKFNRKWIPYKYLNCHEKKKLMDIASFKDHQKQVSFRNKNKEYKGHKEKHVQKAKPPTPHNTSQYLTSNFAEDKNEHIISINDSTKYLENDMEIDMYGENFNVENFCITGGSMKGMINLSNFLGCFDQEINNSSNSTTSVKKFKDEDHREIRQFREHKEDDDIVNYMSTRIIFNKEKEDCLEFKNKEVRVPLRAVINITCNNLENREISRQKYERKEHSEIKESKEHKEVLASKSSVFLINCLKKDEIQEIDGELFKTYMSYLYDKIENNENFEDIITVKNSENKSEDSNSSISKKEHIRKDEFISRIKTSSCYQGNETDIENLIESTINSLLKYIQENNKEGNKESNKENQESNKESKDPTGTIIFLSNEIQINLQERVVNLLNKLNKSNNFSLKYLGFKNQNLSGIPNINAQCNVLETDTSRAQQETQVTQVTQLTLSNYKEEISSILGKYLLNNISEESNETNDTTVSSKIPETHDSHNNHETLSLDLQIKIIQNKKDYRDIINSSEPDEDKEDNLSFKIHLNDHDTNIKSKPQRYTIDQKNKIFLFTVTLPIKNCTLDYELELEITNIGSIPIMKEISLLYDCQLKHNDKTLLTSLDFLHFKDIHIEELLKNKDCTKINNNINNINSITTTDNSLDDDCFLKLTKITDLFQESKNYFNYISGNESAETLINDLNKMISQVNNMKNIIEDKRSKSI